MPSGGNRSTNQKLPEICLDLLTDPFFPDINVLVALLDLDHVHHARARSWLQREASSGWASCPLTQNGCVRIMAQPKYPNPLPPAEVGSHRTIHIAAKLPGVDRYCDEKTTASAMSGGGYVRRPRLTSISTITQRHADGTQRKRAFYMAFAGRCPEFRAEWDGRLARTFTERRARRPSHTAVCSFRNAKRRTRARAHVLT
jgi:hypothetical protein